jgi:dihydroorotate dehydrogenase
LEGLLRVLQQRNNELGKKPLLVKIAPDLSDTEVEMIVDVCVRNSVDGIIATNTTVSRSNLRTPPLEVARIGAGGLSGRPLGARSTEIVSQIYRLAKGRLIVIGVGGIFTPEDAFEKIAAGASLLQAYTGFVYGGPSFADRINRGLAKILREKQFRTLDEAVGSAVTQG